MSNCTNCSSFVVKGRFCDECKFILIDGRHIICKLCKSPKNARTMTDTVCIDCSGKYSRAMCEYCESTQYVKNGDIICDTCSKNLCIYCTSDDSSLIFPSKLFGDVICTSCSTKHDDVICSYLHDTCGNTKHICCVCKDLRPYKKNWMSYSGYVDMIGNVDNLTRWYHYCPHCKSACENICSSLERLKIDD
jgi:hypothetical protein